MAQQRGVKTHASSQRRLVLALAVSVSGLWQSTGSAQQDDGTSPVEHAEAPRNYLNLRLGSSSATADSGHPDICAETTPLRQLSVEACGNGSGILHESGSDLMHLRLKWNVLGWNLGSLTLEPNLGVGMAELQVASDQPGFRFADTGANRTETAGAEGVLQLRALYPVEGGFELIGAVEAGAAYLPHAGELLTPKPELLPFLGVSLGFGF